MLKVINIYVKSDKSNTLPQIGKQKWSDEHLHPNKYAFAELDLMSYCQ